MTEKLDDKFDLDNAVLDKNGRAIEEEDITPARTAKPKRAPGYVGISAQVQDDSTRPENDGGCTRSCQHIRCGPTGLVGALGRHTPHQNARAGRIAPARDCPVMDPERARKPAGPAKHGPLEITSPCRSAARIPKTLPLSSKRSRYYLIGAVYPPNPTRAKFAFVEHNLCRTRSPPISVPPNRKRSARPRIPKVIGIGRLMMAV
jgi:hypothetical protein